MYSNSAYWHNIAKEPDNDFEDNSRPLFVIACGTGHLFSANIRLHTHRPHGRLDYQIIYIASGKAHFYFNGAEKIISAGNTVLYRPGEEQDYYYYGTDQTEVYWVHFTGSDVKNMLQRHGIADDMHVIHTGSSPHYNHLFLQMIQELQLCQEHYEDLIANHLQHLFILFHRMINDNYPDPNPFLVPEMVSAIRFFQENYRKTIHIEEYAAAHHMSVSWFIRCFKKLTNSTPAQYIQSLRMSNAQILLESSNYSIAEIADIIGYENPFYFTRLFKKRYGISPSGYRKLH